MHNEIGILIAFIGVLISLGCYAIARKTYNVMIQEKYIKGMIFGVIIIIIGIIVVLTQIFN